jgi:cob(I)alamin adenosyltransferase
MKGYIQVYTGDGKGKTTAALGLALRAAGAGLKVYFAQFVKGTKYSEHNSLLRFEDVITVTQFGRTCFIRGAPDKKDIQAAMTGLEEVKRVVLSGDYDVVILDEVNIAIWYKLFQVDDLLDLIGKKPPHVEIVITGRNADPRIIEAADLVTEMKELKHYYKKGVSARDGIEK